MVAETRSAARKRRLTEAGLDPEQPPQPVTKQGEVDKAVVQDKKITLAVAKQTRPRKRTRTVTKKSQATATTSKRIRATVSKPAAAAAKASKARVSANHTGRPGVSMAFRSPPGREKGTECSICGDFYKTETSYVCTVCRTSQACSICFHEDAKTALVSTGARGIMSCWRCLTVIPMSATSSEFKQESKPEDVFRYSCKAIEWLETKPLYCPKPRCSAFIPPRLYSIPRPSVMESHRRLEKGVGKRRGSFFSHFKTEKEPTACCPECFTLVCTSCRKEYHGEGDKCDPESLQKEAAMGDVKRCPFCASAIEHAGGCTIVGCNCGQFFCITCLAWPCTCSSD